MEFKHHPLSANGIKAVPVDAASIRMFDSTITVRENEVDTRIPTPLLVPKREQNRSRSITSARARTVFSYSRKAASLITLVIILYAFIRGQFHLNSDQDLTSLLVHTPFLDPDVSTALKALIAKARPSAETSNSRGLARETVPKPATDAPRSRIDTPPVAAAPEVG
jgi:hypothetical protein